MKWSEVREVYLNKWVVIEAIEAHSTPENIRYVEDVSVIRKCDEGSEAMSEYRRLHKKFPLKEYYFVHTSRKNLDIPERKWLGIRC